MFVVLTSSKAEEFKRRKDMELEDIKRKIEGEAELTLKFEEAKKQFEKDIENLKGMLYHSILFPLPSKSLIL